LTNVYPNNKKKNKTKNKVKSKPLKLYKLAGKNIDTETGKYRIISILKLGTLKVLESVFFGGAEMDRQLHWKWSELVHIRKWIDKVKQQEIVRQLH
jgi:hypothetical protein